MNILNSSIYFLFFLLITLCAKQTQSPQNTDSTSFVKSNHTLGDVLTFGIAIADVDLDLDNDIFIGVYNSIKASSLWINDGNGNFSMSSQQFGYGNAVPHDVDIADLNGDSYPDIFMVNHNGPNIIYFNNGDGTFVLGTQNIGTIGEHPQTIQLIDVDGDLDNDAYIYNSSVANRIWENDGNGFYTVRNIDYGGNDSNNQFLADFNNDSLPDLFVSMRTGPAQIWMNDGTGNITNSGHTLGGGGESIDCHDVDGDNDTDIVVAAGGEITIWLNQNNTGTFVSGFTFGEGATECKLFDADLDGDFDLVTGGIISSNKLWLNNGSGSFSSQGAVFGNSVIHSLETGDLDGDGDEDVVLGVEPGGGGIAIYFNESTISGVDENNSDLIAKDFRLLQNYPNPFNITTNIEYNLPEANWVELTIYERSGQKVNSLVNEFQSKGNHKILWEANDLGSGVYFIKMKSGMRTEIHRAILLK